MKVLITGGFGYIGGRLAQFLIAKNNNNEVLLGSRHRVEIPAWLPEAQVVQIAWDKSDELENICSGVDVVVHLAGMNMQDCATDSIAAIEFNVLATARLIQAAVRKGVKRFVYLSTAHVYGSPLDGVITEKTCPLSLHPYATSHRAGEDVVRTAHHLGEIEGIVVRLSNAFGCPAHKEVNCWMLLVNDLCRQAVQSQQMVLRSSGMQRRDFITMLDVCRAINHLLCLPIKSVGNGLINVGGEWSPTVWEMASLIQERCEAVLGFKPKLTRTEPQINETASKLEYRIDTLHLTGYQTSANRIEEIDQLLKFCKDLTP
jgi:UDP-glucose 4-epimerase